jgi:hypothetical protein
MEEKDKRRFRTVPQTDMEEYEQKLRAHRISVVKRTMLVLFIVIAVITGLTVYMALRHYDNYDVLQDTSRADTEATHFADFKGNILKYSNDGAFYIDTANELIWNQTYEMTNPQMDLCGDYLTLYDKKGNMIYILNAGGLLGSIETTMPIEQVRIAAQGTIAVLMSDNGAGYVALYDKTGENLVQGAIHGEKKGYPIAIALSEDAIKLAVSMLDINDGTVKSTVAFYNFGSVGQNEIDHVVGAASFEDTVIPELEFVSNDRLVAFSDTGLLYFEGAQKPQQAGELAFEKDVKSIFYNQDYVGIVTSNDDEAVTNHVAIYDMSGKLVLEKDISMEYTDIEFLSNNEICIHNEDTCDIYTIHGIYKFHHEFEQKLYRIIPGNSGLNYTLVLEDTTEKVRLK